MCVFGLGHFFASTEAATELAADASWFSLARCSLLTVVSLVTYAWLVTIICNCLIYSEAFVAKSGLLPPGRAKLHYRPFLFAVVGLWSLYPIARLGRLLWTLSSVAEHVLDTALDITCKVVF